MVDNEITIKLFFGPPEWYHNNLFPHLKKNLRYAICTTNRYCWGKTTFFVDSQPDGSDVANFGEGEKCIFFGPF